MAGICGKKRENEQDGSGQGASHIVWLCGEGAFLTWSHLWICFLIGVGRRRERNRGDGRAQENEGCTGMRKVRERVRGAATHRESQKQTTPHTDIEREKDKDKERQTQSKGDKDKRIYIYINTHTLNKDTAHCAMRTTSRKEHERLEDGVLLNVDVCLTMDMLGLIPTAAVMPGFSDQMPWSAGFKAKRQQRGSKTRNRA